jgi:hypothetical protein
MYTEQDFQDGLTTYVGVFAEFYCEWLNYTDSNGNKPNNIGYLDQGVNLKTKSGSRVKINAPHKTVFSLENLSHYLRQAKEKDEEARTERIPYILNPIDIVSSAAHSSFKYAHDCMINHIRKGLTEKQYQFDLNPQQLQKIFFHLGNPFQTDSKGIVGFGDYESDELNPDDLMRKISSIDDYLGLDYDTLVKKYPISYAEFMSDPTFSDESKEKLNHLLKTGVALDRSYIIDRRVKGTVDGRSLYNLARIYEDNYDDFLDKNKSNEMILDLVSYDGFLISVINLAYNTGYFRNTNSIYGAKPNLKFHVNSGGFTGFDTLGGYLSIVSDKHYKISTLNHAAGLTIESNGTLYRTKLLNASVFGGEKYQLYGHNSKKGITVIPQRHDFDLERGEFLCPARKKIPDEEVREHMEEKSITTAMQKLFEIESKTIQFYKQNLIDNYQDWKDLARDGRYVIPKEVDEVLSGKAREMIIERETKLDNNLK